MAEGEKGIKWWLRFVVVPLLAGGGLLALILNPNAKSWGSSDGDELGTGTAETTTRSGDRSVRGDAEYRTPSIEGASARVELISLWRGSCGQAPDRYSVTLKVDDGLGWTSSDPSGEQDWAPTFGTGQHTSEREGVPVGARVSVSDVPLSARSELRIQLECWQRDAGNVKRKTDTLVLGAGELQRAIRESQVEGGAYLVRLDPGSQLDVSADSRLCQMYGKVRVTIAGQVR